MLMQMLNAIYGLETKAFNSMKCDTHTQKHTLNGSGASLSMENGVRLNDEHTLQWLE